MHIKALVYLQGSYYFTLIIYYMHCLTNKGYLKKKKINEQLKIN